jgi:hypothetical protein
MLDLVDRTVDVARAISGHKCEEELTEPTHISLQHSLTKVEAAQTFSSKTIGLTRVESKKRV